MIGLNIGEPPPAHHSWAQVLASMPTETRNAVVGGLTQDQMVELSGDWWFNARREQLPPPGEWFVWMVIAGRGWGKTLAGSQWLIDQHKIHGRRNTAIIAATSRDLRKYCLEGESGIFRIAPADFYPHHEPSKLKMTWPNGSETHFHTALEPERLRGPNYDAAWCDEMAAWERLTETWEMLDMTLRSSKDPRICGTTTPKPLAQLREILDDPDTVSTGGPTFDNASNLSKRWLDRMRRKYEGTRLGYQELYAQLLDEAEGALWKRTWIEEARRKAIPRDVTIMATVVGVDPAMTAAESADETGIIVVSAGDDGRAYVVEDLSGHYTPNEWAETAIRAYDSHRANYIIAERNNGGEMVENTIALVAIAMANNGDCESPLIPVYTTWASQGKAARAEPVAALYEQGRVSHIGELAVLEDQLCTWEPLVSRKRSPDRLDALVWAMNYLFLEGGAVAVAPLFSATRESYFRRH